MIRALPDDEVAQPRFRIAHLPSGFCDFVAHLIEAERQDLEEQRLFAGEVVIEARLRHPQRAGDIVHRRAVEPALAEDLRGRAEDL